MTDAVDRAAKSYVERMHYSASYVAASRRYGMFIDTRTGFIYAALEANEKRQATTNAWESRETADRTRRDAEKTAFKGLVSDLEKNWPQILERAKKGA